MRLRLADQDPRQGFGRSPQRGVGQLLHEGTVFVRPGQTQEMFVPAMATGSLARMLTMSVGFVPLVEDKMVTFTGAEVRLMLSNK